MPAATSFTGLADPTRLDPAMHNAELSSSSCGGDGGSGSNSRLNAKNRHRRFRYGRVTRVTKSKAKAQTVTVGGNGSSPGRQASNRTASLSATGQWCKVLALKLCESVVHRGAEVPLAGAGPTR